MARRKVMTLEKIRKHRKNIMRGLSALSYELEQLAEEATGNTISTDEADFIEDMVYGYNGADDIISELVSLLMANRSDVKRTRRGGGGSL